MGFMFLKHPSLKRLLYITKFNCVSNHLLWNDAFWLLCIVSSLPQAWVWTSLSCNGLNWIVTSFPIDHIATCMTFWYPGPLINHWLHRAKILLRCTERHAHTAGLTSWDWLCAVWRAVESRPPATVEPTPFPPGSENLCFQLWMALLQSQPCSEGFL